ncbi:MAG: response regulator [Thiomicrospira sp.]|jgi:CheY-like chemotaxis protein|nr:response regulator [Thiomicrospira sp.]
MQRLRILLVDDKPFILKVQSAIIESLGHEVTLAESGAMAFHLLASESFDLILMDMNMPVIDGLSSTQSIRNLGVKTPIVALTGNDTAQAREQCLAAGMQGFMAKPISKDTFNQQVSQILTAVAVD